MGRVQDRLQLPEVKKSSLRQWLVRRRILPLTGLARFCWRTFAVAVSLHLLSLLTGSKGIVGGLVSVLYVLAYVVAVPVAMYILSRWLLSGVLWRLRNRLIVTYLFIGAAPVLLLVVLGIVASYFLSGQFAAYLATSDLHAHLDQIASENQAIAAHIAADVRSPKADLRNVPELRQSDNDRRTVELFATEQQPSSVVKPGDAAVFAHPAWVKGDFKGLVNDGGALYFRASRSFTVGQRTLTLISSEPLDSQAMRGLLGGLGRIVIYPSGEIASRRGDAITVDDKQAGRKPIEPTADMPAEVREGEIPAPQNRLDMTFASASPLSTLDWNSGNERIRGLTVTTRPSVLYNRLFSTSTVWGSMLRNVLFGTAIFFGFLEIFALFIGMRLTRSITHAIYELYRATQQIEKGELRHRIRIRSSDQLAALEGSFNTMSESLEKLLQEQREKQRLQSELAIAQEVQEQLFPRAWTSSRYLDLFGVCRPARSVSGDYYDFLPLSPTRTGIAMGDISGKGISAALLMATIQSAVRSYEFDVEEQPRLMATGAGATSTLVATQAATATEHSPAATIRLLNRHLFRSTPPEKYATMFFGVHDAETHTLTYTNAGHLPPLVIRSNGQIEQLTVSGTVIGLFEDMEWEQSEIVLAPGDILAAYSDGMTEPENEFGEFGEERLADLLRQHRTLPLEEVARQTITAVLDWIGESEQPDDITIVLARPVA